MARGDILYVELPPTTEHEQAGTRPAVAVQANESGRNPMLMMVLFTSQLSALHFPHTIRVEPSAQNGLRTSSILLVFQLRAISKGRILRTVGKLETEYVQRLDQEMRRLLGL